MKLGLFLGCTIPARVRQYEISTRRIAKELGIEFVDVEDFSCCGFPLKAANYETAMLLAARNLSLAEEKGITELCTMCSACTENLTEFANEMNEDEELRGRVNKKLEAIGKKYNGTVKVRHICRILIDEIGVEKLQEKVVRPLDKLNVTAHFGCHYVRPSAIYNRFDDPEMPSSLKELIKATGANYVEHSNEMQCCGGGILAVAEKVSLALSKEKLDRMKKAGADIVCLICPFCGVMYDANQRSIEEEFQTEYKMPVLFYPQLLGLAMGLPSKELGLNLNVVKTKELVKSLEAAS
ncbi:MAG: CoB--CoM heterodisulfide reductase subunit B [Candidatus Schekmanbacteria bacterium]|nr:MAG: CoB--CoM heterodisulfide reductase subunit B [Candidatus Schekmanbacteria bacterium]